MLSRILPLRVICGFVAATILPTASFSQGDLTPPGAPAATMKTLNQIEPRIDISTIPGTEDAHHHITQPGSYYLTGNLAVTKGIGILVTAAGVTLDLNGFELARTANTGDGIVVASERIQIRNGSLRGFALGIFIPDVAPAYSVRNVTVTNCSNVGILAVAHGGEIVSCRATKNTGSYGILAGHASTVVDSSATENEVGSAAIAAISGGTFRGCTASNNTAPFGIAAGNGSSVVNCTANNNTSGETVSGGISVGIGSSIVHSVARQNTSTAAAPTGFTGMGFEVQSRSQVRECAASANRGDGIKVSTACLVRDNISSLNGSGGDGAGIHATGPDNRIEGNTVTGNDRGIHVQTGVVGNLILKNSASENTTHFEIGNDNPRGPIVNVANHEDITPVAGSNHPWANFVY